MRYAKKQNQKLEESQELENRSGLALVLILSPLTECQVVKLALHTGQDLDSEHDMRLEGQEGKKRGATN